MSKNTIHPKTEIEILETLPQSGRKLFLVPLSQLPAFLSAGDYEVLPAGYPYVVRFQDNVLGVKKAPSQPGTQPDVQALEIVPGTSGA